MEEATISGVGRNRRECRGGFGVRAGGFSLIELMVSMSVLALLMLVLASAVRNSQDVWMSTRERVSQFREARAAMEAVTRRMSQATLNSYWGYDDPDMPKVFQRNSELHFVSGPVGPLLGEGARVHTGSGVFFQAPFGYAGTEAGSLGGGSGYDHMDDLLNCWGYFVEYGSDLDPGRPLRPPYLAEDTALYPERRRFRLMEFRLPSERLELYRADYGGGETLAEAATQAELYRWFGDEGKRLANSRPIAENILAIILSPRAPVEAIREEGTYVAPDYYYDSRRFQWAGREGLGAVTRHQLPPVVELTVVALDEASWDRYSDAEGEGGALELADFVNERFVEVSQFQDDLEELEEELIARRLGFRIFTTAVPIRAAKWITGEES